MKKSFVMVLLLLLLLVSGNTLAQLVKLEDPTIMTETEIYYDNDGKLYSDIITINFKQMEFETKKGQLKIQKEIFKRKEIKNYFKEVEQKYGEFVIEKVFSDKVWQDTICVNKRNGKASVVPNLSQTVKLKFNDIVPVEELIQDLQKQDWIDFAEPPLIAYSCLTPNDPGYSGGQIWAFNSIHAEEAWDISTGLSTIVISINDRFGVLGGQTQLHNDLVGKVLSHTSKFGDHGTTVAGVAGAVTSNNSDVASLGWDLNLRFHDWVDPSQITQAVTQGVDIINFSWITQINYSAISNAIQTALASGIICVAAAGNDSPTPPVVNYPAAYNFGATGQVIAVSATTVDYGSEDYRPDWNYSPGTDPISNPTTAFIDFAAPGGPITVLRGDATSGTVNNWGTSLASPMVSALVGLMLSVDNTLTVNEIYDILVRTCEKAGTASYDGNGWSRRLGYGRINAYDAVNVASGAPSKPDNLSITPYGSNPKLYWDANPEGDINEYVVYISENGGSWYEIGRTSRNYYVDTYTNINNPIDDLKYSVVAKNTSNRYSIKSDAASIMGLRMKVGDSGEKAGEHAVQANEMSYDFDLSGNSPNPFNPSTNIFYTLPVTSNVHLTIYNTMGQEIKSFEMDGVSAGVQKFTWDGTNENNEHVSSGIYIYRLRAVGQDGRVFDKSTKMMLLK